MNKEMLEELGFKQYEKTYLDSPACNGCWQKLYRDDKGKKYFLDVKHYDLVHPTTGDQIGGYEIETQVYLKGSHDAINIKFLNDNLEEAEKFVEFLFKEGKLDYYEEY